MMMRHQRCLPLLNAAVPRGLPRPVGAAAAGAATAAAAASAKNAGRRALPAAFSAPAATTTGSRSFSGGGHTRDDVLMAIGEEDCIRNSMAYSLAFAASDGSNQFPALTRGLSVRELDQLRVSIDQLCSHKNVAVRRTAAAASSVSLQPDRVRIQQQQQQQQQPLPRTLQDALRPTSRRAIVVTETTAPFRVVDVNRAWEDLCGYSYVESRGKSLGSLLKGPETDPVAVTALVNQLLRGEEATAVITNYTKDGRKFLNRLHVGPLYRDDAVVAGTQQETRSVAYFVGVLNEVMPAAERTAPAAAFL